MSEWWRHLWDDPINSNPWAFGALIVILAALAALLVTMEAWMFRRRNKETIVPDEDRRPRPAETKPDPTPADIMSAARSVSAPPVRPETANVPDPAETEKFFFDEPGYPVIGHPQSATSIDVPLPDMRRIGNSVLADPWVGDKYEGNAKTSARAAVPQQIVGATRETCPHCGGTGYVPSISDLLRESAGWITDMDGVVIAFYRTMLTLARKDAENAALIQGATAEQASQTGDEAVADLAFIFPRDLITAAAGDTSSRGAGQRDKLAGALVALATMYDPTNHEQMQRLDNALISMGNRHASFVRRDGTIKGATLGEYDLAKRALVTVLATLGDRLTAEHAEAWSIAYDYAASGIIQAQLRSGFTAPRFPAA